MRCSSLEQLLPQPLLNTLIARPELETSAMRITWVKTQMEHARGLAQATAYGPGTGKDASGDVYMSSVDAPPGMTCSEYGEGLVWALHAQTDRREQHGHPA